MPTDICSLSRLALSCAAFMNFPLLYLRNRTVPFTGYRFTCTSKTFMKIEIRVASPAMNEGSSTSVIMTTRPSAGATTSPSPRSPVRSGSRKK